jgi:hypothetical protein
VSARPSIRMYQLGSYSTISDKVLMKIRLENANLFESEKNIPVALKQTSVRLYCYILLHLYCSKQYEIFCTLITEERKDIVAFPQQHSTVF